MSGLRSQRAFARILVAAALVGTHDAVAQTVGGGSLAGTPGPPREVALQVKHTL